MDGIKNFFSNMKDKIDDILEDENPNPPDAVENFNITITTESLGIRIAQGEIDGMVYVVEVTKGTEARKGGVRNVFYSLKF